MTDDEITGILAFLGTAERLKDTLRTGHTAGGRVESTAEHSWRLCLLALVLGDAVPGADVARLMRICLVHDLAEALTGDIPAPQAREAGSKAAAERAALASIAQPLPPAQRAEILALWEEYETGSTREGRLAKGLDKIETLLQHVEGRNPASFDLAYNLGYGRAATDAEPLLARIRARLDDATRAKLAEEALRDRLGMPAAEDPQGIFRPRKAAGAADAGCIGKPDNEAGAEKTRGADPSGFPKRSLNPPGKP